MWRSKKMISQDFGKEFWAKFKDYSDNKFSVLIKEYPDIGKSMFAFNYAYAPSYVAWWYSMENLGLSQHECEVLMLKMNEKMLLIVPKFLLHLVGKAYYKNMSSQAKKRVAEPPKELHPFDWKINYRKNSNGDFDIDILTCGFIAYTQKYGCANMLPAICQVDYLISHYMNVGFDRTQTLGAGGKMCDCKYCLNGKCDWNIEKRLQEKK